LLSLVWSQFSSAENALINLKYNLVKKKKKKKKKIRKKKVTNSTNHISEKNSKVQNKCKNIEFSTLLFL
jgi:hypothetical protein